MDQPNGAAPKKKASNNLTIDGPQRSYTRHKENAKRSTYTKDSFYLHKDKLTCTHRKNIRKIVWKDPLGQGKPNLKCSKFTRNVDQLIIPVVDMDERSIKNKNDESGTLSPSNAKEDINKHAHP